VNLTRLDLDGAGSPSSIAARIHELEPGLPLALPIEQLCRRLDIGSISEIATGAFEAALVMDELKAHGSILLAAGRMPERQRYSLGHELGHFLIPSHRPTADRPFQCSLTDFHLLNEHDRDHGRRIEAEANRFAAHLLMPPVRVRKLIGQGESSLQGIVAMAREFQVSKEAMARAWVDANRNPAAIIVLQHGRVERCYRHDDFPWIAVEKGQQVPEDSLAAGEFQPGTYSEIEEVDPETWLSERDAKRTLELTEQVLAQRDGFALVLLQIELDDA
jgi:Zn-dependent peptidase ImmA (M78 family)